MRPNKPNTIKSKKKQEKPVHVPSHLTHLVMPVLPPASCPWSLSGPQFPQPTAIQQRYCYPKGPAGYGSGKGGALWTMYDPDGNENLDFRLLHVYFSAKRAVNKGNKIPEAELAAAAAANPLRSPARGNKKRKAANQLMSPPRRQPLHTHRQQLHPDHPNQSPAITASSFNSSSSLCSSPLSFDVLMPPSPARGLTIGASTFLDAANAVSPPDPFRRHFHPIPDAALLTPSPFRRGQQQMLNNYSNSNNSSGSIHSILQSPVETTRGGEEDESKEFVDPFFSSDMDTSLLEIDCYWNDPLLNTIMLKPSLDFPSTHASDAPTTTAAGLRSLAHSLEGVQDSIRKSILAADHAQQPALVSLVAAWARRVAKDPLQSPATLPEFPWQPVRRHPENNRDDTNNGRDDDDDDDDDGGIIYARNGPATAAV
jgi:hypothetical protein